MFLCTNLMGCVCVCLQFAYDKQQEVNVSFHIKEKDTERKIDSTLTGWCCSHKSRQSAKVLLSHCLRSSLTYFQFSSRWILLISSNLYFFFTSPIVVLYNCSVGREDCSLCKHADAKYQCVWCTASHSCVYQELCVSPQPAQCPEPEITDVSHIKHEATPFCTVHMFLSTCCYELFVVLLFSRDMWKCVCYGPPVKLHVCLCYTELRSLRCLSVSHSADNVKQWTEISDLQRLHSIFLRYFTYSFMAQFHNKFLL